MSIVAAILTGEADDELDRVVKAVQERRKQLVMIRTAAIRTGQRVKLVDITPARLKGVTGEVVAINGSRFQIKVDEFYKPAIGRFLRPDGTIAAPMSTVAPE